jgi:hypothetical protein
MGTSSIFQTEKEGDTSRLKFARTSTELLGGISYPEKDLVKPPRLDMWHTGSKPSRLIPRKGAVPLSGAEEQTARARS